MFEEITYESFISLGNIVSIIAIIGGVFGGLYWIYKKGMKSGLDQACIQRIEATATSVATDLRNYITKVEEMDEKNDRAHSELNNKIEKVHRAVSRIEGHLGLGPQTSPG